MTTIETAVRSCVPPYVLAAWILYWEEATRLVAVLIDPILSDRDDDDLGPTLAICERLLVATTNLAIEGRSTFGRAASDHALARSLKEAYAEAEPAMVILVNRFPPELREVSWKLCAQFVAFTAAIVAIDPTDSDKLEAASAHLVGMAQILRVIRDEFDVKEWDIATKNSLLLEPTITEQDSLGGDGGEDGDGDGNGDGQGRRRRRAHGPGAEDE